MRPLRRLLRSLTFTSVTAGIVIGGWSIAAAISLFNEFYGASAGDQFGKAVACRGNEVLIGAPFVTVSSQTGAGAAYTLSNANPIPQQLQYPPFPTSGLGVAGAAMGTSVTYLDDVSGDLIPDIAIGLPGYGFGGAAAIYYSGQAAPALFLDGGSFSGQFGASIVGITSLKASNVPALVIGAPGSGSGRVDVFDGLTVNPTDSLVPPFVDSAFQFGSVVAGAGDINGDQLQDLAVAAQRVSSRSVYIYRWNGSSFFQSVRLDNPGLGQFGASIAAVGDLNGDSIDELLVGAPAVSGIGHAYLFSGADLNDGISTNILCDLTAPVTDSTFGTAVSSVGSSTAYPEGVFLVSAPGYNNGGGAVFGFSYISGVCQPIDNFISGNPTDSVGVAMANSLQNGGCPFTGGEFNDLLVGTQSDQNGTNAGSVLALQVVVSGPTPTPTATPTSTPLATVTPTPTDTPDPSGIPKSSRLTFRLDNAGNFSLKNRYDLQPQIGCELILYQRIVVNGKRSPVREVLRVKAPEQTSAFSVSGLPKVRIEDDSIPEVHMIGVTICGDSIVDSNVFARYLNCGLGTGVSSPEWSRRFRQKMRNKYQ